MRLVHACAPCLAGIRHSVIKPWTWALCEQAGPDDTCSSSLQVITCPVCRRQIDRLRVAGQLDVDATGNMRVTPGD